MAPLIGMCFDRQLPPPFVVEAAERLESGGADQIWIIEDCFYTAGISLAATALARTERLHVGLGVLPAVARNPAITAMEIATLSALAPGRLLAGIGHGVQEWMEQMGVRTASPLNTLDEVFTIVRRLLDGERVDFEGAEFTMRGVELDRPPSTAPPLLAGVRGPKSLALAGRVADGVILVEGAGPTYVRKSLAHANASDAFRVSVFQALAIADDRTDAHRIMAPFLAGLMASPNPAIEAHPHIDEMRERLAARGVDGLVDMPRDWWIEVGAIGTFEDAITSIEALHDAGAHDVSLFPGPQVELAREDLEQVARIVTALR